MRRGFRSGVRFGRAAKIGAGRSIARLDRELVAKLDDGFRNAAARAGCRLACRPGCSGCCHGPFPITRLDVRRLQRGWVDLRAREGARATAIRRRAIEAVAALEDGFPGRFETGRLTADEQALDRFFERHAAMPCPALDPVSGCCELYAARPVACRTYGPPIRFGSDTAPPCRLCFRGAAGEVVSRCTLDPDPWGLEQAILARMGVAAGQAWETLIAFVLARGASPRPGYL
jgi:Fe-S-cluster containining protein